MLQDSETVVVVLDPQYGERIQTLMHEAPVWVVDAPENRQAWDNTKPAYANSAIFKVDDREARVDNLVRVLPDVEEHFGPDSTTSRYSTLRVIGLQLTDDVAARLRGEGLSQFRRVEDGFEASAPRR